MCFLEVSHLIVVKTLCTRLPKHPYFHVVNIFYTLSQVIKYFTPSYVLEYQKNENSLFLIIYMILVQDAHFSEYFNDEISKDKII